MKTRLNPFSFERRTAGFTLMELMLVLGISTMLLTMSVAAFQSMLQSKGVDGARQTISAALFTARMKAIGEKRDVTCAISAIAAEEWGFVAPPPTGLPVNKQTLVVDRLVRPGETFYDLSIDGSAKKAWVKQQFAPKSPVYYWAIVVGGLGSGSKPAKISGNYEWYLNLDDPAWEKPPGVNSMICILKGIKDSPVVEQFKVTSDLAGGAWEALPAFIYIDASGMPVTFRPDGSALFRGGAPLDHGVIRLADMRVNEYWAWRMVIDRGSGRSVTSQISTGAPDYEKLPFFE